MTSISRWSESNAERVIDSILTRLGANFTDPELHIVAELFGHGLPHQNALELINGLNENGMTQENRPVALLSAIGGPDGVASNEVKVALIIGAAEVKAGHVNAKRLSESLTTLGFKLNPEASKKLDDAIVKDDKGVDHISVDDVVDVIVVGSLLKELATKVNWSQAGSKVKTVLTLGRKIILRR